jgi:DME family drug/metabolite transporter
MWNALFVVIGAALWATDTLFRHPLTRQISPLTIVYYEHIFATLISLCWLLLVNRKNLFLGWKEMFGAAFVGIFGSAVATVLFTMSFQFINPSVAILLQKTQPIIAIFLSSIFLGEKITGNFIVWAGIAICSAFLVSFPSGVDIDLQSGAAMGCVFALIAAGLWAMSTVVGKVVLHKAPSSTLSFWRFAFGLIAMYILVQKSDQAKIEIPFVTGEPEVVRSLLYMAILPGFLGVSIYYKGLSKVKASVATLLELVFPLTAICINSYFLGFHLMPIQLFAAGALLVSMLGISASNLY